MVTKQRREASKAVGAVGPVHSFVRIAIMSGGGGGGGGRIWVGVVAITSEEHK